MDPLAKIGSIADMCRAGDLVLARAGEGDIVLYASLLDAGDGDAVDLYLRTKLSGATSKRGELALVTELGAATTTGLAFQAAELPWP